MTKKRNQVRAQQAEDRDSETIPEEEQWRIIEQSGVLKNIPRKPSPQPPQRTIDDSEVDYGISFCDELFNAALLVIPFSSLYIMMDILGHRQYGQTITFDHLMEDIMYGIPMLSLFIFYSVRHKQDFRTQALLFLLSIGCGCRMIYVVNWGSWKTVMKQCPPLGTVWVYTIVQLNLWWAVCALGSVAAYVRWKDLKIIFN